MHHFVVIFRQAIKWRFQLISWRIVHLGALEIGALMRSYFWRGYYSSHVSTALKIEALILSVSSHECRTSDISAALLAGSCHACLLNLPMFIFLGGIFNNFENLMSQQSHSCYDDWLEGV